MVKKIYEKSKKVIEDTKLKLKHELGSMPKEYEKEGNAYYFTNIKINIYEKGEISSSIVDSNMINLMKTFIIYNL